jgi:hypothetical protein
MKSFSNILGYILFATVFFMAGYYYSTFKNTLWTQSTTNIIDSLNTINNNLIIQNEVYQGHNRQLKKDIETINTKIDSINTIISIKDGIIIDLERKRRSNSDKIRKLNPEQVANGLDQYLKLK